MSIYTQLLALAGIFMTFSFGWIASSMKRREEPVGPLGAIGSFLLTIVIWVLWISLVFFLEAMNF